MYKDLYNNINNQIKEIEIREAEEAKIRSKAQWREQGETSSRYFCSLEKKRAAEKSMRSVQLVKDGEIYTETDDMVKQTRNFYTDLYTEEGVEEEAQETLLDKIKVKLTKEEAEICEGAVTYDEVTSALKQTQNDKSPGTDGITYEFYKAFWHLLGKDLVGVLQDSFQQNNLTKTQNMGLLTLLFKKGDRALLCNWRPI